MQTNFGPEAREGDYVIVLDVDYIHRRAANYIAKVYNNKAYTGQKTNNGFGKYIHKLSAIMVIPESYVSEEIKERIEEDVKFSNKEKK